MNALEATKILGIEQATRNQLYNNQHNRFINSFPGRVFAKKEPNLHLAGYFTRNELEAMLYWMDHREEFGNGDTTHLADAQLSLNIEPRLDGDSGSDYRPLKREPHEGSPYFGG